MKPVHLLPGKKIDEEVILQPSWSNTFETFWSNFWVFVSQKSQKPKLSDCITSEKLFNGYLQWNLWTYFRKIYSWAKHPDIKLIKNIWNFKYHSFVYALQKQLKILNLQSFFTSKIIFGGFFQWNMCTYFHNVGSWKWYSNVRLIIHIQIFRLHSSVFALQKQPAKLNFQSFFTSKKPFEGYFQWKPCTYFQKICKYSDAKLIKNIWNIVVALLDFWITKTTQKAKFSEIFTCNKLFGGYFQWNACKYLEKICS